ncbi:cellulose binding domain-containing protein [Micromonospora sp. WMMD1120]|uniref:cellulose binding domain-containing protein n=1 Tax=Micromonospora sp. WMMD1120 TaxID=3016106 RepID=UPI002417CCBD|nr:cellulose binding domain-containing protein [Micromonospora sp. WMMD1120]MDG4810696.1 cellulose binding domain-containing protein [Micromonospora sp. WMMD1120]
MLRKLLAVTTLALATLAGVTTAAGATTAAEVTPLATPTPACPPALPITATVTGATTTSLTISYWVFFAPPCGYNLPMTVTLYASREDAEQWRSPVGEVVTGPERNGAVTFDRLNPDTEYWYRFTDADGRRDPYAFAAARTAPLTSCRATATIDARWGSGFVATVTVRNTGVEPLDRWRVSWRWSGDERVQSVWGGVAETTGADVVVGNASYNGALALDGVTTFGMLVATGATPDGLTLTCAR